jgi:hypothetical protein
LLFTLQNHEDRFLVRDVPFTTVEDIVLHFSVCPIMGTTSLAFPLGELGATLFERLIKRVFFGYFADVSFSICYVIESMCVSMRVYIFRRVLNIFSVYPV